MRKTTIKAKKEFDILNKTVEHAVISPYEKEILALCEKFDKSGQSGGSAQYTAKALSIAIEKLLLHMPICDITGDNDEWDDVTMFSGAVAKFQNNRCSAVFKGGIDGRAHYLDAIVWKGEEEYDTFTGGVYIDNKNFEFICSSQYVKFPFKPKTFYVDVIRVPILKEEAEQRNLHYIEDGFGECYYTILKDPSQLDEVFSYYDKK